MCAAILAMASSTSWTMDLGRELERMYSDFSIAAKAYSERRRKATRISAPVYRLHSDSRRGPC